MFKIGNVEIKGPVIAAPMAGVSNKAFRKMCKEMGANLTYTEMTSNVGLKYNSNKTLEIADIDKSEGVVALQIFGGSKKEYVEAAKYFDKNSNASIIDINMGCPVPKVAIKSQAGSALMKPTALEDVEDILTSVVKAISKPLTIKIRIGWDKNSLTHIKVAKIAEKAGVAMIAVHGRTRNQMYKGKADWSKIKEVKDSVSIPVIGNGDITSPEEAKAMIEATGVDGVMIAREGRENPWIYKQINQYLKTGEYDDLPTIDEVATRLEKYYNELVEVKGEKPGRLQARGIAAHWLSRFKGAQDLKQNILMSESKQEFINNLNIFVKKYKELNKI